MTKKITPSELTETEFLATFGGVFEKSPWIAEALCQSGMAEAYNSADGLHNAMAGIFKASTHERRLNVLLAHPDLAGKLAQRGELTPESTNEQKSAGLDQLTPEEFSQFQELNTAYMDKHGFPFIIAVKGLTKSEILTQFKVRVNNSNPVEFNEACMQVEKIAKLRITEILN